MPSNAAGGASLVTYDHFLVPVFGGKRVVAAPSAPRVAIAEIGDRLLRPPRAVGAVLTLAIGITVAVMAIFAAAAFYAFDFENAMREADANHLSAMVGGVGGLQENTFLALKAAFTTAVAECAPSVFSTAQVAACRARPRRATTRCAPSTRTRPSASSARRARGASRTRSTRR